MKRFNRNLIIIFLTCLMVSPAFLPAQTKAADDVPEKIAVINIQQAIGETDEGRQALLDLQKKYQPRQQSLQQQGKDITALQDKLQNQSTMLSDQERYDLTRELDEKQRHFKTEQGDAQADYQDDMQEAVRQIGQKMVQLIGQYAPAHHFALVIGDQQIPVYYASKAVDITEDIVALYNKTYPVKSASAAATPASAAKSGAPGK
ncbi:MAG TPA: OmpH family outer membrane protein [Terriglobia bacterium]|nr:OmpH family outer membrane protein [Terriglobia bacterium]